MPATPTPDRAPGYYGQPIIKAPVWTWQIGLYFFIGGTAGMSAVLALAGLVTRAPFAFVQAALALAFVGVLVSPILLTWDLGRPERFLNMLRVFKWRSAMSMGVWTLVAFSTFTTVALALTLAFPSLLRLGLPSIALDLLLIVIVAIAAILGAMLATYTGVLLGATAVPVWAAHHRLLPFHFGIVAIGSAAATMELLGFRLLSLHAIGFAAAAIETGVGAWIEITQRDAAARALTHGPSGLLLRASGLCTGPATLVLRATGWRGLAAIGFLIGAVLSRYGWLHAGRVSARNPEETINVQRG
jgi:Polysulphide reductase, NrfD